MYRFVSKSDRITGLAFHASGFRSDALRCFRPAFALFFVTTKKHYISLLFSNNPFKRIIRECALSFPLFR